MINLRKTRHLWKSISTWIR